MTIHKSAAAALADKTPGGRVLSCGMAEAWKLAGQPAVSVDGTPGYYSPPGPTGTGTQAVGIVFSLQESHFLIVCKASAEQLDDILERTEYADAGVALGEAAADQDLRRAAQREIARRMGYDD